MVQVLTLARDHHQHISLALEELLWTCAFWLIVEEAGWQDSGLRVSHVLQQDRVLVALVRSVVWKRLQRYVTIVLVLPRAYRREYLGIARLDDHRLNRCDFVGLLFLMGGYIWWLWVSQGCLLGVIIFLFLLSKLVRDGNQILSLLGFIIAYVRKLVDVSWLLLEILLRFDCHNMLLIMTLIVDHQDTVVRIGCHHHAACVAQSWNNFITSTISCPQSSQLLQSAHVYEHTWLINADWLLAWWAHGELRVFAHDHVLLATHYAFLEWLDRGSIFVFLWGAADRLLQRLCI